MLEEKSDARSFSPFIVGLIAAAAIAVCLLALMWPTTGKQTLNDALPMAQGSLIAHVPVTTIETVAIETEVEFDEVYDPQQAMQEQKLAELEAKMRAIQDQIANTEDALPTSAKQESTPTPKEQVKQVKIEKPSAKKKTTTAEQGILAINKQHYALQLVAAGNEQKVRDFITRHKLTGKAHYYKGSRNGKPWYTVVYGDFADKKEALASVSNLPAEVKKLGPWARQYSSIQKLINNKNE